MCQYIHSGRMSESLSRLSSGNHRSAYVQEEHSIMQGKEKIVCNYCKKAIKENYSQHVPKKVGIIGHILSDYTGLTCPV